MKITKITIEFNEKTTNSKTRIECASGGVVIENSLTKGQIKKLHRTSKRQCKRFMREDPKSWLDLT